jgi:NADPH:quinone reductase-like Zn-dependent oxidoreductase
MRALVCRSLGNPSQPLGKQATLDVVEDFPSPSLSSNAVRIKVAAASLNFADALQIMVGVEQAVCACTIY